MASKRRLRRKQCGTKRRYESHIDANEVMMQIIRSGRKRGGWLHVYKCRFCHGWHFGHAMGGRQGAT
jgi:hypothetical protein